MDKRQKNKTILSINCMGEIIDLKTPKVMGILNITPDSFYDGGKYNNHKKILKQTEKLCNEGATFIDIGAYSSRPGALFVSEEEELKRLIPVVDLISKSFTNIILSIDTFRSKVMKEAFEVGGTICNDISAGKLDSKMMSTVAKLKIPYIMMHMVGTPQTMTKNTNYINIINDLYKYFSNKITEAKKHKIIDLIIDVGFGFSKTKQQNFLLLKNLDYFNNLGYPILTGISRKSMIYKTLNCTAKEALNGTTALNMIALKNGTKILRVHDVKEAIECVNLFNALNNH